METPVRLVVLVITVILMFIILGKMIGLAMQMSCTIKTRVHEFFNRPLYHPCKEEVIIEGKRTDTSLAAAIQEAMLRCTTTYLHDPLKPLGYQRYCIPCATIRFQQPHAYTQVKDLISQPLLFQNGRQAISIYNYLKNILPEEWASTAKHGTATFNPLFSPEDEMRIMKLPAARRWRIYYYQNAQAGLKNIPETIHVNPLRIHPFLWETIIILPNTPEGNELARHVCGVIREAPREEG